MRKNKLLLLLALLMTAATGAWATDYTTLAVGDVIKVGDTFSPTAESAGVFNNYGVNSGETYTLIRADVDNDYNVTEKTDGAYYVFKYDSEMYPYINFEKAFAVTANSDGLEVTNIKTVKGMLVYTLALHESAAAGYTVSLKDGVKDADKWTISPNPAPEGSPVTIQYTGRLKVKSVKAVKKAAADPLAVPLTIEAITAGTIRVNSPKEGMQYSLNGGAKTAVTTTIEVVAGDKVQFYGNGTSITYYQGTTITGSGDGFTCKVYGNIMSLVDEENFATAKKLSEDNTFYGLFFGFNTLTDASGLLLPATQLAENCYLSMFNGCTALTTAPALPATQLAAYCYRQMFSNCSALTAAPALPATQLAESCYLQMFYNCKALTAAPELPATQLTASCYYNMFRECSALTAAPALPATELAVNCYYQMFRDCTSLTAAPALPATQLASSCYRSMFLGCTALTTAPELPATQLEENCYNQMFGNCSALTASPVLPAETLVNYCYRQMFASCSKLATVTCLATSGFNNTNTSNWLNGAGTEAQGTKTFNAVSTAEWPSGNSGIPNGWTRVNIDN